MADSLTLFFRMMLSCRLLFEARSKFCPRVKMGPGSKCRGDIVFMADNLVWSRLKSGPGATFGSLTYKLLLYKRL